MIQPFWTVPLLAIRRPHVRQFMGCTHVAFLVSWPSSAEGDFVLEGLAVTAS